MPLSGVRLHAIACGPGIETLPQFVCLAVDHRGSTAVCVAGADRRINAVFIELLNGDRTQSNTDETYRTYGTAFTDYIVPRFLLSLHTTPKRNSKSTVTSRSTPQQGTKLLYLLVKTTTGIDSTSLSFAPAT